MKILLTSDHNPTSVNGVIVSVLNLKMELEKRGEDVKLLCLSPTKESYVEGNIYYVGSISFKIYPDVRAAFNQFHPFIEELIDWCPDIIHSQCEFFTYSFVHRIATKTHAPIVHTYHTMYEHYVRYVLPIGNWSKMVAPVMRQRLKTSDVVIAPTRKVRDSLVQGKVAELIRIIPTGIDLSKFDRKLSHDEKKEILDSLNIPEGARIFGSVGRLAEEKNYSEILSAMKRLIDNHEDLYLVLTGDGTYRKHLEEEAEELGISHRVRFPGMVPVDKVFAYYQILEFFVSASVSETQGLTYIEALANGLPVIARRDGAIDNVVISDSNGYQYESEKELLLYVERILADADLLHKLQQGAIESRRQFGTEIFGERVYQLYKEILNRDIAPKLEREKLIRKVNQSITYRVKSSDVGTFYATIRTRLSRHSFERKQRQTKSRKTD